MNNIDKLLIFLIGTLISSFIGVIIYRRPKEINFLYGRSKCEYCNNLIPIYLNIPIISFILLKGKSKCCNKKIDIKNLIYEISGGLILLYSFIKYGLSLNFLIYAIELYILEIIFFTDLNTTDIYDIDLLILLILEIIFKIINKENLIEPIKSSLTLGFIFLLIYILTKSIGLGDLYLAFCIGFMNDFYIKSIYIFSISFIIAAIISIILIMLKIKTMKDYIPFAPFLIIAYLYIKVNI